MTPKSFSPSLTLAAALSLGAQALALLGSPAFAVHPLDWVPEDTAYVYARIQPYTDQQLQVVSQPSANFSLLHSGYQLGELIFMLDQDAAEQDALAESAAEGATQEDAEASDAAGAVDAAEPAALSGTALRDWKAAPARRLLLALRDELDQIREPEDLARVGIKPNGVFAFYGVDLMPVLRLEASGLTQFSALMQRLQVAYGTPFVQLGTQAQPLWAIDHGELRVLVGRLDEHLLVSVVPQSADPSLWRKRLLDRPRKALGASGLSDFNRTEGFLPVGSGFVDTLRLVESLSRPSELLADFEALLWEDTDSISAVCHEENLELARSVPRLVVGATRMDRRVVELRFAMQLRADLAAQLAATAARAPDLHGPQTSLSMSVAFAPEPLIEFIRNQVAAVAADPWKCPELLELNDSFAELGQTMATANAAMSFGFQGLSVAVDSVHIEDGAEFPSSAELSFAIHTTQPAMMLGMLQLSTPQLAGVGLQADSEPFKLELEGMPEMLGEIHGLHGERVLAAATGPASADRLRELARQDLVGAGPLMSLRMGAPGLGWLTRMIELDPTVAAQPTEQRERTRAYNRRVLQGLELVDVRFNLTAAGLELNQLVRLLP